MNMFLVSSISFSTRLPVLLSFGLLLLMFPIPSLTAVDLEEGFRHPPQSAGIRCFWWWLNGNVTKEAITSDLEEMKVKGFSGALIFDAGGANQRGNQQVPAGPTFLTPEWRQLFQHAIQEAHRLGLELSLSIQSGWNLGGPNVTPDIAAKMLTWSEVKVEGPHSFHAELPEPKKRNDFYKDIAVLAFPLKETTDHPPIQNLREKAVFRELGGSAPDCRFLLDSGPSTEGEEEVYLKDVVDLTDRLTKDSTLQWDVPSGRWVILRFGYTLNGGHVSTYSADWSGLVLDYMDTAALDIYWNQVVDPLLEDIGPHTGKTLRYLHTDSWECGGANWTQYFPQEFQERCGYDILPYLPVFSGRIVESREKTNAFLADFRKTIGACVAENNYKRFAELAHQHGMGIHPEAGGPHAGPFDAIKNLSHNDLVMGEFWVPSPHRPTPQNRFFVKQSSSVAHIYGKKYVGAEAFTSIGPHWDDVLWKSQKPSFDHEACSGLNMVFVHTFTCSPKETGIPGQEYFAGTHFNPNVTWWEYADPFVTYLSRCQFLLQQGSIVADALYYYGDHVPNLVQLKEADPAQVLPGFDYDVTNEDILLKLKVKNGKLTVPGGVAYRVLVLPDHKVLSLAALQKVEELLHAGATIIGPKAERFVSLVNYPASWDEFETLSNRLWGESPSSSGMRKVGKGRLIWGKTARQVLIEDGIKPDCEIVNDAEGFDYIHYTIEDADVYFLCNQTAETQSRTCRFRVTGKQPELWDPLTGEIRSARAFQQTKSQTTIPLQFSPYGSLFVVFRKEINTEVGSKKSNDPDFTTAKTLKGPWQVSFDPKWGGPENITFEKLVSWTERPERGIQYYSGKATYTKKFHFQPKDSKTEKYFIDLGNVVDVGIARVQLNGKSLGTVWTPPFRVDTKQYLQPGENILQVVVINSWRNRLVGDRDLPVKERYTKTNITIRDEWQLLESGLLGPVTIQASVYP